ncbi:ester cyclase [Chitinophaga silvatica]|nr:ester cyclase [Chitinophaga silvatica]
METITNSNRTVVQSLYRFLNNKTFDQIQSIVSEDYVNDNGEKGINGFTKGFIGFINAFPDAKWTISEVITEGDKVVVMQTVEGTQKNQFQNIPPTNKKIQISGVVIYELEDGLIINHIVHTDRLGVLQQLGVLPTDLSALKPEEGIYLVDKFNIPQEALNEFTDRMEYNRKLIRQLPGFIKDEVLIENNTNGYTGIMTVAVWQNQKSLDHAKEVVQADYKKIDFNPATFTQRLNITMVREIYHQP